MRAWVAPGAGLVARSGAVVLWVDDPVTGQQAVVNRLLDVARAVASNGGARPGRTVARRLAGLVGAEEPDALPAFAAVALGDDGLAVLLHGAADLAASNAGDLVHLSAREIPTWVDRILPRGQESVAVGRSGGLPVAPSPDSPVDLVEGVVPGGGVVVLLDGTDWGRPPAPSGLTSAAAAATPAAAEVELDLPPTQAVGSISLAALQQREAVPALTPSQGVAVFEPGLSEASVAPDAPGVLDAPDALDAPGYFSAPNDADALEAPEIEGPLPAAIRPQETPPFVPVPPVEPVAAQVDEPAPAPSQEADVSEGPERSQGPGVVVKGVRCPDGHFNRPDARACTWCGAGIDQQALDLVEGTRPSLGMIVLDDGSAIPLEHDYVVGRDPRNDQRVRDGEAVALELPDPDKVISRVHADLRLEGWDVILVDRHSANGTHVLAPGGASWTRLEPEVGVLLEPGSHVQVGRRSFVFESDDT